MPLAAPRPSPPPPPPTTTTHPPLTGRCRFEELRAERISRYAGMNLYVKNLHDDLDDETLRTEFAQFGTITSAKVMVDSAGKGRGFGFVCYASPGEEEGEERGGGNGNGGGRGGGALAVGAAGCWQRGGSADA